MTRLHKFLDPGGLCPVTGVEWPLGVWVARGGALDPIGLGHLVYRDGELAHWAAAELYRAEIDGEIREDDEAVIAERVRLIEPRPEWPSIVAELAQVAVERTRELTQSPRMEEYHGDLAMVLQHSMLPHVLLISATMCAHDADPNGTDVEARRAAFRRERAWQSRWIADRLP